MDFILNFKVNIFRQWLPIDFYSNEFTLGERSMQLTRCREINGSMYPANCLAFLLVCVNLHEEYRASNYMNQFAKPADLM